MKFTKRETRNIKHRFDIIQNLLGINKIYEDKNTIPKLIKKNLILYGIYTGRIIEIIYRKTDFNKEENNLNADELILETFGPDFFRWLTVEHKGFINGDNIGVNNIDNINNNNDENSKDE